MPAEPAETRAVVFVDGQNLFYAPKPPARRAYDVALVLSQDQDLSEVADGVRQISIAQRRWIKVASAFPASPTCSNRRGVNGTDWVPFDRAFYDAGIDPIDSRTGPGTGPSGSG